MDVFSLVDISVSMLLKWMCFIIVVGVFCRCLSMRIVLVFVIIESSLGLS